MKVIDIQPVIISPCRSRNAVQLIYRPSSTAHIMVKHNVPAASITVQGQLTNAVLIIRGLAAILQRLKRFSKLSVAPGFNPAIR